MHRRLLIHPVFIALAIALFAGSISIHAQEIAAGQLDRQPQTVPHLRTPAETPLLSPGQDLPATAPVTEVCHPLVSDNRIVTTAAQRKAAGEGWGDASVRRFTVTCR